MIVKFMALNKEDRKEVSSALKGNGLKAADVNIHKDGSGLAVEVKKTGHIARIK